MMECIELFIKCYMSKLRKQVKRKLLCIKEHSRCKALEKCLKLMDEVKFYMLCKTNSR